MTKTYSVAEAVGFLRGWIAARGAQDPFVDALEIVITAATSHDIPAELAHLREVNDAQHKQMWEMEQELKHHRSVEYKPQPLPEAEAEIVTQSQKNKKEIEFKVSKETVIEAIANNYRDDRLLPQLHETQVRCYQCKHYHAVPGKALRHCEKYDIDIKRGLARRECIGFDRLPLERRIPPRMYCNQCKGYIKHEKFCRVLSIPVKPNANRYMQCPYHMLDQKQQVMKHSGSNKAKYDEQNKKEGK